MTYPEIHTSHSQLRLFTMTVSALVANPYDHRKYRRVACTLSTPTAGWIRESAAYQGTVIEIWGM